MKMKSIGWGIALVAVATLATTGTVYAATNSAQPETVTTTQDMRSLLLPIEEQPESYHFSEPMTMADGVKRGGAFTVPAEMVFDPKSCVEYLEAALGPMDGLDGWLQFGNRVKEGANDYFLQAAVHLPGSDPEQLINDIRRSAATCESGTVTNKDKDKSAEGVAECTAPASALNGCGQESEVGVVSYLERSTPDLPDSVTYGATWRTTFEDSTSTIQVTLVATTDTLIIVLEPAKEQDADRIAAKMLERLHN